MLFWKAWRLAWPLPHCPDKVGMSLAVIEQGRTADALLHAVTGTIDKMLRPPYFSI